MMFHLIINMKKALKWTLVPVLILSLGLSGLASIKNKKIPVKQETIETLSLGVSDNDYLGRFAKIGGSVYEDNLETGMYFTLPLEVFKQLEYNSVQPKTIIITPAKPTSMVFGIELKEAIGSYEISTEKEPLLNLYTNFSMNAGGYLTEFMQDKGLIFKAGLGLEGRLYIGPFFVGGNIERDLLFNPSEMTSTLEQGMHESYEVTVSVGLSF